MSADWTAPDPYRSPNLPEGPYAPASGAGRPGWLTALCVMCIVIGVLGLMNGLIGSMAVIFGQQLQSAFNPTMPGNMPQGMRQLQQNFQNDMNAVQAKFFAAILLEAIVRMLIAGTLVFGGVRALSLKADGRTALLIACAAAILFEICFGIVRSMINMEIMTAFNAYIERFMDEMPRQQRGPPPGFFISIMKGSFILGLVIQYGIVLVKLVFYTWAVQFLQRQAIRALFVSPAEAKLATFS